MEITHEATSHRSSILLEEPATRLPGIGQQSQTDEATAFHCHCRAQLLDSSHQIPKQNGCSFQHLLLVQSSSSSKTLTWNASPSSSVSISRNSFLEKLKCFLQ